MRPLRHNHDGEAHDGMVDEMVRVLRNDILTNHRVIEVSTAGFEYEHRLARILRESACEDQTSSPAADNDVVVGLARDMVEGRQVVAHDVKATESEQANRAPCSYY